MLHFHDKAGLKGGRLCFTRTSVLRDGAGVIGEVVGVIGEVVGHQGLFFATRPAHFAAAGDFGRLDQQVEIAV